MPDIQSNRHTASAPGKCLQQVRNQERSKPINNPPPRQPLSWSTGVSTIKEKPYHSSSGTKVSSETRDSAANFMAEETPTPSKVSCLKEMRNWSTKIGYDKGAGKSQTRKESVKAQKRVLCPAGVATEFCKMGVLQRLKENSKRTPGKSLHCTGQPHDRPLLPFDASCQLQDLLKSIYEGHQQRWARLVPSIGRVKGLGRSLEVYSSKRSQLQCQWKESTFMQGLGLESRISTLSGAATSNSNLDRGGASRTASCIRSLSSRICASNG